MLRSCVPTASSSSRFCRSRTSTPTIATLTNVNSANATARRTASRRHTGRPGRAFLIWWNLRTLGSRLEAQHMVERPGAAPARQQKEQDRGPGQVLGVRIRIDDGLDDEDHAQ